MRSPSKHGSSIVSSPIQVQVLHTAITAPWMEAQVLCLLIDANLMRDLLLCYVLFNGALLDGNNSLREEDLRVYIRAVLGGLIGYDCVEWRQERCCREREFR